MTNSSLFRLVSASKAKVTAYIVIGLLAAILLQVALAFGAFGVYLWLIPAFGAGQAAFITAGIALLAVILMTGGVYLIFRSRQKAPDQEEATSTSGNMGSDFARNLEAGIMASQYLRKQVKENPKEAALIALVGGVVLGTSPNLASSLIDTIRKLDI